MKRLPISIQDFVKIREGDYLYVDKTADIHRLITTGGGVVFLSRPRRFGKSLLCSALEALFEGRRKLFEGLAIDSLGHEWKEYPVIRIDLNSGDYSLGRDALYSTVNYALDTCEKKYGVSAGGDNITDRFVRLIEALYRKYDERVAVIIDEYDKPLLSTIDMPEVQEEIRSALKAFYGVLKASDQYLHFSFITGVTKFSKVSIFSDLNNLDDISLKPQYATICGITQEELEQYFSEELDAYAKMQYEPITREEYLDKLRRYYNGYRFSEKPVTVFNLFGLLFHFDSKGKFRPYWYESGTPTFLINLIKSQQIDILGLESEKVAAGNFTSFDVQDMDAVPVLYQSGYLTIKDYNVLNDAYTLSYPNEEVRAAFSQSLIKNYVNVSFQDANSLAVSLPEALNEGDASAVIDALIPFLASIPYDIQIKQEKYYQTIIHLIFRMLGYYVQSEVRIAAGRIDSIVETKEYVYCFEFKLKTDGHTPTAEEALTQIEDKEYLTPWKGNGKKLMKIGVVFDYEKRNIGEWAMR